MAVKLAVSLTVRGADLPAMLEEAQNRLDDLDSSVSWTITEAELWGDMNEPAATRDGLVSIYSATIRATASK